MFFMNGFKIKKERKQELQCQLLYIIDYDERQSIRELIRLYDNKYRTHKVIIRSSLSYQAFTK